MLIYVLEIFFVILVGFLLWYLLIRPRQLKKKYGMDHEGIMIARDVSDDQLITIIKERLDYPGLQNCFLDEFNNMILTCKYGTHLLRRTEDKLYVQREGLRGGKQKQIKFLLEAECIKRSINKILHPGLPISSENLYRKISYMPKAAILSGILIVLVMGMLVFSDVNSPSAVSEAFLKDYSTTQTIGEVFDHYFKKGEWRRYQSGGRDFCEFKGAHPTVYTAIKEIQVTFELVDGKFGIYEIFVNGNKTDPDGWEMIMKMIYGYY